MCSEKRLNCYPEWFAFDLIFNLSTLLKGPAVDAWWTWDLTSWPSDRWSDPLTTSYHISYLKQSFSCLYFHSFGLDDVDLVPVPTPHFIMHHSHAPDRVMRTAQVQQVVVGQIPLTVYTGKDHEIRLRSFWFWKWLIDNRIAVLTYSSVEYSQSAIS